MEDNKITVTLPESYIIMISPKDFFGKGRHIYRFRNIETTDHSLELGDETMKIFLNSHGKDDVLPELKNFLDLVNGEEPEDDYCRAVDQEVKIAKLDAETRRNYMEFEYMRMLDRIDAKAEGIKEGHASGLKEGHESGLQEGIEIGQQKGAIKTLVSLVSEGSLPIDVAIKHSGLAEQEFRKQLEIYRNEKTS